MQNSFLRRKQAGAYLKSKFGFGSSATLAKLATVGGGPEYQLAGRLPLYTTEALDIWASSKISAPIRNSSEAKSTRSIVAAAEPCAA